APVGDVLHQAHGAIVVEHQATLRAIHPVILAVPVVLLARRDVAGFILAHDAVRHAQHEQTATIRSDAAARRIPGFAADPGAIGARQITELVEVMHRSLVEHMSGISYLNLPPPLWR